MLRPIPLLYDCLLLCQLLFYGNSAFGLLLFLFLRSVIQNIINHVVILFFKLLHLCKRLVFCQLVKQLLRPSRSLNRFAVINLHTLSENVRYTLSDAFRNDRIEKVIQIPGISVSDVLSDVSNLCFPVLNRILILIGIIIVGKLVYLRSKDSRLPLLQ